MRLHRVGLLLLLMASSAFGQATGFVKSLGFQSAYRPDCWTALLVHLDSTISDPAEYEIQVHQQDMDKDLVVYRRTVTLGPQARQDFWAYFQPQPTGRIADGGSLPARPAEVNEILQVHLYDKTGRTEIARLKAEVSANNLDPIYQGNGRRGGTRVILCVCDTDLPSWSEYTRCIGLSEQVQFIPIKPFNLPESVLAYQGIDGIIWFDANAIDISSGGSKAFDAVQQYVRQGGVLVVCQPTVQLVRIAPFANAGMLPIIAKDARGDWAVETRAKPDLEPLIGLATVQDPVSVTKSPWKRLEESKKEWDFVRAKPTPDAFVDTWIDWNPAAPLSDRTPYIARKAYGMGAVTWVAHDLGDPALMKVQSAGGWPHVWDRVFAWKNRTTTDGELARMERSKREDAIARYAETGVVDIGASLRQGLEHAGTAATYIFIAILFFIVYWLIAGPGSYLFLAAKKRSGMSWTIFGVVALAAAGLTVLVVKLVLRGSPTAHHVTIVKLSPADPAADGSPRFNAVVRSRFGLYVPRDGEQAISINDLTPGQTGYISPYAIHPKQLTEDTGFTDRAKYIVSTDEPPISEDKVHLDPVRVDVPYRSTLKKLQAEWTGTVSEGITGSAKLVPPEPTIKRADPENPKKTIDTGTILGKLTNKTGRNFQGTYLAFNNGNADDWLLYLGGWPKDATVDLELEFNRAPLVPTDPSEIPSDLSEKRSYKGLLSGEHYWGPFWYSHLGSSMIQSEADLDDHERNFAQSLPLMAFFSRIEPQRGEKASSFQRSDLLRRGGRDLDVSHLISSGQLVIVARATETGGPPMPLTVDGDPPKGEGTVFYEMGLPLDRSGLELPTAQPSTRPATQPSFANPVGVKAVGKKP